MWGLFLVSCITILIQVYYAILFFVTQEFCLNRQWLIFEDVKYVWSVYIRNIDTELIPCFIVNTVIHI